MHKDDGACTRGEILSRLSPRCTATTTNAHQSSDVKYVFSRCCSPQALLKRAKSAEPNHRELVKYCAFFFLTASGFTRCFFPTKCYDDANSNSTCVNWTPLVISINPTFFVEKYLPFANEYCFLRVSTFLSVFFLASWPPSFSLRHTLLSSC